MTISKIAQGLILDLEGFGSSPEWLGEQSAIGFGYGSVRYDRPARIPGGKNEP